MGKQTMITNAAARKRDEDRKDILRAVKAGKHMRGEIEKAVSKTHLSNALGHMVRLGLLHTQPAPGHKDKHGNPQYSYWLGANDAAKEVPDVASSDPMTALLEAWPIPAPQMTGKPFIHKLVDERHNGEGLSCVPRGVAMQSSMR